MANSWFRLWHDMITDPKWATIARLSGRTVSEVITVAVALMTDASSNATERGRTQSLENEDLASLMRVETEHVEAIRKAMEGRFVDGDLLLGWEKRQPNREDGSAERGKLFRLQQKVAELEAELSNRTQPNAIERKETLDKDKDIKNKSKAKSKYIVASLEFEDAWAKYPDRPGNSRATALKAWNARIAQGVDAAVMLGGVVRYAAFCDATGKTGTEFVKQAATFFGPGEHYLAGWEKPKAFTPVRTGKFDPLAHVNNRNSTPPGAISDVPTFDERGNPV